VAFRLALSTSLRFVPLVSASTLAVRALLAAPLPFALCVARSLAPTSFVPPALVQLVPPTQASWETPPLSLFGVPSFRTARGGFCTGLSRGFLQARVAGFAQATSIAVLHLSVFLPSHAPRFCFSRSLALYPPLFNSIKLIPWDSPQLGSNAPLKGRCPTMSVQVQQEP